MKKKLKVGFDLDGVILYNPARTARPLLYFIKHTLGGQKDISFFVPKSGLAAIFWFLVHKSSLFPAPGMKLLKELVEQGKIEAYIVTGRFAMLAKDSQRWIKRFKGEKIFKEIHINMSDEQPHHFKTRMVKKLGLDIFVEDNWDIIQLLIKQGALKKTRIFWLTNILDHHIPYKYKFRNFRQVMKALSSLS